MVRKLMLVCFALLAPLGFAQNDRTIKDGDRVILGGTTLTAHLTPGHTKGCTTWSTIAQENGRNYHVVFLGGVTIPGYKLAGNTQYPNIAEDYAHSFALLKQLPCDIFLGAHGSYFDLENKVSKLGGGENPFVNPEGYHRYIAKMEAAFKAQLRRERTGVTPAK